MIGWNREPSDSPPNSPPRSPTYKRVCREVGYDEEEDDDEMIDSDADTFIIDTKPCFGNSAGDDDREFERNFAGEHHHFESSPSPTDVEDEEGEDEEEEGEEKDEGEADVEGVWNDDDVDEGRVEFANDFDGCEDVHVRFRLLLDEIDQIHQMLGDIDRADDDGYYSLKLKNNFSSRVNFEKMASHFHHEYDSSDDDDGDEWAIVDWGEDEEAEEEIIIGFSEATR
ncbi:ciliogenesis-associated TTC17-interacting protein-like [Neodiprion virginianus]|uniref:ciliogenesis-associated TTC17-interacting protein-like n=1 Tax=Neodiprion virginianus TaxID=2961670 RepID=UPI001EE6FD4E|nr:ciliogenesis-associated TTC17-interacting protein-like [Neodiprion virginianus]